MVSWSAHQVAELILLHIRQELMSNYMAHLGYEQVPFVVHLRNPSALAGDLHQGGLSSIVAMLTAPPLIGLA